jgi:NAD(P)-dependent dehydrogenase (short-subunit alcohol dehydrogenase family)
MTVIATRQFQLADQHRFAALTGDANPMHVDPVAARRTQFGAAVVHGVHGLMWALDAAATSGVDLKGLRGLTARFVRPILVGDTVEAQLGGTADDVKIELIAGSVSCTSIRMQREPPKLPPEWPAVQAVSPLRTAAHDVTLQQMQGLEGAFEFAGPGLAAAFPAAAEALGLPALEGLAASTYIVGMETPGLYSLYSRLVAALEPEPARKRVDYRVALADPNYRVVDVLMRAPGLNAKLNTFARVPPVEPASLAAIRAAVKPGEFAGQRALVIGGSRGLGAATAKIIAAGGGKVAITYANGAAEAEQVAADIRAGGGDCEVLRYDATGSADQIDLARLAPNAIYYFATGPIWRRKAQGFDDGVLRDFLRIHVDGFVALAKAARAKVAGRLALFYPSSVYVAEPPADLHEYAQAKRMGETAAADLAASLAETSVVVERLPAVATDQNATVVAVNTISPVDAMLPHVRRMQAPV